jgi:pyruvate,water dikinase
MAEQGVSKAMLKFEAPGPGFWMLEATHFARPVTRFVAEIFPEQFMRAYKEGTKRYGMLLDYHEWRFVNGWSYLAFRPVGPLKNAPHHPPKQVWDQLMASDPEISERLRTSETVFERKLWREDLHDWDQDIKPAAIRDHLALQALDPSELSTESLLAHLQQCRENLKRGYYLHHRFNIPAVVPAGDFLVHAEDWTGRSATDLLRLLQGSSPISLGAADELKRLAQAVDSDPRASALLFSPKPAGDVLIGLQSLPSAVGAAASAYIGLVGYRPVSDQDVGGPYALEMPELLVKAIRSAVGQANPPAANAAVNQLTAQIRDAVPQVHRPIFDELLAEARLMSRLRDERAIFCDLWACGLARRAILAGGRRLATRGRLAHPTHLAEAGFSEITSLLANGSGPSDEELAERARYRAEANSSDAPPVLGTPPGPPLPAEWLPPPAARLDHAFERAIQALFLAPQARSEARKVRGLAVSQGLYEGTARLVRETVDFARIQKGDILVTTSTTAAFNVVLPLLGAIVTDRGGLLSHAAIVAREYGIPAVVGCTDATRRIPDGARVRVDGGAGEAVVL